MNRGAKTFFAGSNDDATARTFPPSVELTPARGACCKAGGKCKADPTLWQAEGWKNLNFSVDADFYYSYEFLSDGSSYTARAIGDLDCNGVYSTFEWRGSVVNGEPTQSTRIDLSNPNE